MFTLNIFNKEINNFIYTYIYEEKIAKPQIRVSWELKSFQINDASIN